MRLTPGLFHADTDARPAIKLMLQGSRIELLRPDGSTIESRIVTYGISTVRQGEDTLVYYGNPKDPEIKLTIAARAEDVPVGTEVWLVDTVA